MGTWAAGNFGNDTALDFVESLSGFSDLNATLESFSKNTGELDTDQACIALAACDLVAACIGRPAPDMPDIAVFEEANVSDDHLEKSKALVKRVKEKSELAEVWAEEKEERHEWQEVLDDLILRLTPSIPYESPSAIMVSDIPEDFLGYCYICYEIVTERDGITFEYTEEGAGTITVHPHRKCIETQIPGPHWNPDGTPSSETTTKLLLDMGLEIE